MLIFRSFFLSRGTKPQGTVLPVFAWSREGLSFFLWSSLLPLTACLQTRTFSKHVKTDPGPLTTENKIANPYWKMTPPSLSLLQDVPISLGITGLMWRKRERGHLFFSLPSPTLSCYFYFYITRKYLSFTSVSVHARRTQSSSYPLRSISPLRQSKKRFTKEKNPLWRATCFSSLLLARNVEFDSSTP
jgi:hypothetical protein